MANRAKNNVIFHKKMLPLATAVVAAILLFVLPINAEAAEIVASGTCGDNLTWELDDAGTLNISGIGKMHDYYNFDLSAIPWYSVCDSIQTIVIQEGVENIGSYAFNDCINLTTVHLSNSVSSIGTSVFCNCNSLTEIGVDEDNTFFNGLNGALYNEDYSTLLKVPCAVSGTYVIPDGVTTIGHDAFRDCRAVTAVEIPNGVTVIGNSAFLECDSLTSIEIPEGVSQIGQSTFSNCDNLADVTISEGVKTIANYAFANCTNLVNLSIPDSITRISEYAFTGCENLEYNTYNNAKYLGNDSNPYVLLCYVIDKTSDSIMIHSDTQYIYRWAFAHCEQVSEISIPDSVKIIDYSAFYACTRLKNITIGKNVITIYEQAFANCQNLTSIVIPDSVLYIGDSILSGCKKLQSLTVPFIGNQRKSEYDKQKQDPLGYFFGTGNVMDTEQYFWDKRKPGPLAYGYYKIPYTLRSVTVTGGEIFYGAFYNCKDLKNITIGANVSAIHEKAFYGCRGLSNIYIEDLTAWCSINLQGADLIESSRNIYYKDKLLTVLDIPEGVTLIKQDVFRNYDKLSNVMIPDSVTQTEERIFYYCTNLMTASIGNGLTKIAGYTFGYCSNLTSVVISDSVTDIANYAFYECNNLQYIYYTGTQEQWDKITIGYANDPLLSAKLIVNYVPPCRCNHYPEWTITTQPTFTTCGSQEKTCFVCGNKVVETLDMLVGKISHWNVALTNDFRINFYLKISESIADTAKVKVNVSNETKTYKISDLEKKDENYVLSINLSAAHLNEYILIVVLNGGDVGSAATYNVRQYCDTILADSTYSQYHALVKEMLNYGAMAQMYFDYDTEYLANDGITGVANAEVPETVDEMTISGKINGVNFYGASLVYRDRIAVRYYFMGDVTGCTFAANGNTYSPVAKDGMYYVEIADILPQDLDQQITLTVTDANGNTLSVTYGPMNYIVRMNEKGSDALKALVKALYNYHLASKALTA